MGWSLQSSEHNSFLYLNYILMTELLFRAKILSSGDNLSTGISLDGPTSCIQVLTIIVDHKQICYLYLEYVLWKKCGYGNFSFHPRYIIPKSNYDLGYLLQPKVKQ